MSATQARQKSLAEAAREAPESFRMTGVRFQAGWQDMLILLDNQQAQLQAENCRVLADLTRFARVRSGLIAVLRGGAEPAERGRSGVVTEIVRHVCRHWSIFVLRQNSYPDKKLMEKTHATSRC